MTLPQGRTPLRWDQLSYPSDALTEAKQQRARAERLERALRDIIDMTGKGAKAPMTAERWLDRIDETAIDALRASQTGGSGFSGVTLSDGT